MRKQLSALILSAAVVAGGGTFAQTPSQSGQMDESTPPGDAQLRPTTTTLRVGGTIEKYDASTRTLSLVTASGTVQFPVAPAVRVRRSGRQIDALELKKLSGYRAAVRYSETHGSKTVESVSVFEKPKG